MVKYKVEATELLDCVTGVFNDWGEVMIGFKYILRLTRA